MSEELSGEARFELKRQLADTLQGRIYSAIDKNTGDWVVVKETWKQLVKLGKSRDGHSVPENFEEEKRILKYLSNQKDAHKGFVRLIDEWEDKDCFLYAMEMCRGGELFEYIKGTHSEGAVAHYTRQQSRLKQEEMTTTNNWIKVVQHMFQQIVECTSWLHSKGVCHLDMSLENSMIASRSKKHGNKIKIIDFGLAKFYSDNKFINNKRVGKTGYMAPEVFARKKYDPRAADIWSLGVMLFMMLIGAPPYQIPSPSNPAFNFIVNGRLRDVLKHWKRLRCINKEALDLLNKIFRYESKRIKMEEILKHPFVNLASSSITTQVNNTSSMPITTKNEKKEQEQEQEQEEEEEEEEEEEQQQQQQQQQSNDNVEQQQQQEQPQQKQEEVEEALNQTGGGGGGDTNINYRSEVARKFAKKLESNVSRDELATIMRDIEQTHNHLQQKARRENSSNSESKLQQQISELHQIHTQVVKKMDAYNNKQQHQQIQEQQQQEQQQSKQIQEQQEEEQQTDKPKVERQTQIHSPHNN